MSPPGYRVSCNLSFDKIVRVLLLFSAVLEPPEIDLCFAISATAANADSTFPLMKETINDVIENYGIRKIRYSVILFGSQARQVVGFDSSITKPAQLEAYIRSLDRLSGGSAIDKALEKAMESFREGITRPNARKVLVVITDNDSGLKTGDIVTKARLLEERNVRVIAVAVGDTADQQELEAIASDKRDVLTVPTSVQPNALSKDITVLVLTGKAIVRLCNLSFTNDHFSTTANMVLFRRLDDLRLAVIERL